MSDWYTAVEKRHGKRVAMLASTSFALNANCFADQWWPDNHQKMRKAAVGEIWRVMANTQIPSAVFNPLRDALDKPGPAYYRATDEMNRNAEALLCAPAYDFKVKHAKPTLGDCWEFAEGLLGLAESDTGDSKALQSRYHKQNVVLHTPPTGAKSRVEWLARMTDLNARRIGALDSPKHAAAIRLCTLHACEPDEKKLVEKFARLVDVLEMRDAIGAVGTRKSVREAQQRIRQTLANRNQ